MFIFCKFELSSGMVKYDDHSNRWLPFPKVMQVYICKSKSKVTFAPGSRCHRAAFYISTNLGARLLPMAIFLEP